MWAGIEGSAMHNNSSTGTGVFFIQAEAAGSFGCLLPSCLLLLSQPLLLSYQEWCRQASEPPPLSARHAFFKRPAAVAVDMANPKKEYIFYMQVERERERRVFISRSIEKVSI